MKRALLVTLALLLLGLAGWELALAPSVAQDMVFVQASPDSVAKICGAPRRFEAFARSVGPNVIGEPEHERHLREVAALIRRSDPVADARLDIEKGCAAPIEVISGYGRKRDMPGIEPGVRGDKGGMCRTGSSRAVEWDFGDDFTPAKRELFRALSAYGAEYNRYLLGVCSHTE